MSELPGSGNSVATCPHGRSEECPECGETNGLQLEPPVFEESEEREDELETVHAEALEVNETWNIYAIEGIVYEQPNQIDTETEAHTENKERGEAGKQLSLFDVENIFDKERKGMPEYSHKELSPWKQITVSFENQEDMDKFSALVEQKITVNTRSIWYPKADIGRYANKRYVDEP